MQDCYFRRVSQDGLQKPHFQAYYFKKNSLLSFSTIYMANLIMARNISKDSNHYCRSHSKEVSSSLITPKQERKRLALKYLLPKTPASEVFSVHIAPFLLYIPHPSPVLLPRLPPSHLTQLNPANFFLLHFCVIKLWLLVRYVIFCSFSLFPSSCPS